MAELIGYIYAIDWKSCRVWAQMCDKNTLDPSSDSQESYSVDKIAIEIYKAYREKVTHEDTLVNFRTTWFVALQALLFTSFALSLGKFEGALADQVPRLFAVAGFLVAATSFVSIWAAIQAIEKTTRKWTHPYKDKDGRELPKGVRDMIDPDGLLPAIKGGGSSTGIAYRGNISSLLLPWIVSGFWIYIFVADFPMAESVEADPISSPEVIENMQP